MWSVMQVAEAANLTGRRIRQLIREGKITAEKVANTYIITEEEAQRWLAERAASQQGDQSEAEPEA